VLYADLFDVRHCQRLDLYDTHVAEDRGVFFEHRPTVLCARDVTGDANCGRCAVVSE